MLHRQISEMRFIADEERSAVADGRERGVGTRASRSRESSAAGEIRRQLTFPTAFQKTGSNRSRTSVAGCDIVEIARSMFSNSHARAPPMRRWTAACTHTWCGSRRLSYRSTSTSAKRDNPSRSRAQLPVRHAGHWRSGPPCLLSYSRAIANDCSTSMSLPSRVYVLTFGASGASSANDVLSSTVQPKTLPPKQSGETRRSDLPS